ncbi:MAG: response regulator [Proteobacteria bacterium]|nr:response regulator [Pseudomonadota bacterium]
MNILVIEDEKIISNAITRVLTSSGHNVHTLNDGFNVISKIQEINPSMVFLDVKMPGRSGLDVLKEIKEFSKNIKVVMMSGYTSPENIETAVKLGANDFLKKPFDDIFELQRIVERNL